MSKSTISVSMIVRNSEDVLERCLKSVEGADEIVVVDTGSETEATKEIAAKYGAKVFDYYGCNHPKTRDGLFMNFADARNYSLDRCTMSHVLIIDADEELQTPIERLRTFEGDALSVLCINTATGEEHRQPRLFKRNMEYRWKGAAHNYVTCPNGVISDALIHYHPTNNQKRKDPDRTMRILERWIKQNPKNCARERFYLSKEYHKRGFYRKAEKELLKYIKISKFEEEKTDAYIMLARAYIGQHKTRDAINAALAALHMNPQMSEAYNLLGDLSTDANRIKYRDMAEKASNWNVLFVRKEQRMRVTILSKVDFAGTGYRLAQAIRLASGGNIDAEAMTKLEGVGSKVFNIQTGPSIYRVGPDVAAQRIDTSDVIIFSGDWAYTDKWEGLPLPDDRIKIYYYIGSFFRRDREPEVSFALHKLEDYVAHYHAAGSPDLLYTDQIHLMEIPWLSFDYKWKPAKTFNLLHVPSDKTKKGSDVIDRGIEILAKMRNDFVYTCQSGIAHEEMMKLKQKAHIYIDQMLLPVYGTAAVEAMSMGVPVMNWLEGLHPYPTPLIAPKERTPIEVAKALDDAMNWDALRQRSEDTFKFVQAIHGTVGVRWVNKLKELVG